jgi:hypothetical protein
MAPALTASRRSSSVQRRVEPELQLHGTGYDEGLSDELTLDYGVIQDDTLTPSRRSRMHHGFVLRDQKRPRKSPVLYLTDLKTKGLYGMNYAATQRMLDAVIRETEQAGLFINVAKNKFLVRNDLVHTPSTIIVEDFKYLGS